MERVCCEEGTGGEERVYIEKDERRCEEVHLRHARAVHVLQFSRKQGEG